MVLTLVPQPEKPRTCLECEFWEDYVIFRGCKHNPGADSWDEACDCFHPREVSGH